jgi:hypothetical protein
MLFMPSTIKVVEPLFIILHLISPYLLLGVIIALLCLPL